MQEMPLLNIGIRDEIGGGKVNRLRREGYIPAIIYGKGIDAIPTKIRISELRTAISKHGRNTVFKVDLPETDLPNKDNIPIIIKEMQNNVITGEITHVDLQMISLTEERRAEVPIRIRGRETVEVSHLIVIQQMDEIVVKCLPQDTPQFVEINVSELSLGDSITAGEIELPEGVNLESDTDQVIVTITEVREAVEDDEDVEHGEVAEDAIDTDAEDSEEHCEDK